MRTVALIVLLVLAGCGGSSDDANNHGYGYEIDVTSNSGLRLRYSPTLKADDPYADITFYEIVFARVQACTGISAPAPFVIIVRNGDLGTDQARYYSDPPLIVVSSPMSVTFAHECIHYLLDYSTGDPDSNHGSLLFKKCW